MKNSFLLVGMIVAVALIAIATALFNREPDSPPISAAPFDPMNSSFKVDDNLINLVGGSSSIPASPGSVSTIETQYFGNLAKGDLNGDGMDDYAFLIEQETGGTGQFYYIVAALSGSHGYRTTPAYFLGDRIAPQPISLDLGKREIIANFAERSPSDPMTAEPSIGVSKYLRVNDRLELEEAVR